MLQDWLSYRAAAMADTLFSALLNSVFVGVVNLGTGMILLLAAYRIPTPRTEVAWRHLGITRALVDAGSVDPTIDAYFNWPGFFAGLGGVFETTGIRTRPSVSM